MRKQLSSGLIFEYYSHVDFQASGGALKRKSWKIEKVRSEGFCVHFLSQSRGLIRGRRGETGRRRKRKWVARGGWRWEGERRKPFET